MKRIIGILIVCFLAHVYPSNAETIYCKNGRVIKGKIKYHSKRSVWFDYNSDTIGISFDEIKRIENDDGTISKYDFRTLYKKAREYIIESEYAKAIDLYDLLLVTFPETNQIHYLRGILEHKLGRLAEAESEYRYLLGKDAADSGVLNNLGVISAGKREYAEAKKWFWRAIQKNSRFTGAHNNLADVLLKTKDYKYALAEYRRVLKLDPNNTQALYNIGYMYADKGKYSLARKQWEKVLSIQPGNAEAKNGLEYLKTKTRIPG